MPFPKVVRVHYKKQPLDNVICQVRFPTILSIDTKKPSILQKKLYPQYIFFKEQNEVIFDVRALGGPESNLEQIKGFSPPEVINYEFASEDNRWKVNLTRNFFSISTTSYSGWEDFKKKFSFVLKAFVEVYKPVLFTRIGLRYTDVIVRSKLDLAETDWVELINPIILGVLGSACVKKSIKHYQSVFVIGLKDDPGEVRIATGLVKSKLGEDCFLIDSDYYDTKKRKADELIERLELFHSKAYAQFRWGIQEKLHMALEPRIIKSKKLT